MFRVAVFLFIASVLLAALALISCLSVEDRRRLRVLPRWGWVLLILLLPTLGAIAYFLAGRPLPEGRRPDSAWWQGGGTGRGTGRGPGSRPRAPDDDPEFLRSLDRGGPGSPDAERRRRREEERRRRERDQRRDPEA